MRNDHFILLALMRNLTPWLFLLALWMHVPAWGQDSNLLTGRVLDATTHQPLPFATIAVKGTVTGTSADAGGFFSLKTKQAPPFTLIISSVGYRTAIEN